MKSFARFLLVVAPLLVLLLFPVIGFAIPTDYAIYPHLTGTTLLNGENQGVAGFNLFGNDYFAVCNENSGLVVFAVAGDSLLQVGSFDAIGLEHDIEIIDWTGFVATSGGLTAVSLAVPGSPSLQGYVHLSGDGTRRIVLSDTHAYVACGSAGLAAVDISNPSGMYVSDWYGADVTSVSLDGNFLAVTNSGRVDFLDVSTPIPALLGYCESVSTFDYHEVALVGDFVYTMAGAQVDRWDFSDPSVPLLGTPSPFLTLPFSSGGRMMKQGSEVVVTANSYLGFIDGPSGIVTRESGQVWMPRDMAFHAGFMVGSARDALFLYQDGLYTNPDPKGEFDPTGFMIPEGIIQGDILYGTSLTDPLAVVAADLNGDCARLWDLDTGFQDLVLDSGHHGDLLAVLGGLPYEVKLYSISRHGITARGSVPLPSMNPLTTLKRQVVFYDDDRLLVNDPYHGLSPGKILIVDVSNPDDPAITFNYFFSGFGYGVHVTDTCFLLERTSSLEIIEAAQGSLVGTLRPGGQYYFTKGPFLYSVHTASYGARLDYWDLSDPLNPVQAGELALSRLKGFVVAGDYAYQNETGLILDLTDPATPTPAGNISLANPGLNTMDRIIPGSQYILTGDIRSAPPFTLLHYLVSQGGTGEVSAVEDEVPLAGLSLHLKAAPNPFNPRVTISFKLPRTAETSIEVFDVKGRKVANMGLQNRQTGTQKVEWDGTDRGGSNLPSGVYLVRVTAGKWAESLKIVLTR